MALILSIDTSNDYCMVVLARYGEVIASRKVEMGRTHAVHMATFAQEMLEEQAIDPLQLDAVAVGCGPGSYTGLRIGVSYAKGICYGASVPLIAVGSLDILVQTLITQQKSNPTIEGFEGATLAPMIDARRMEVYTSFFNSSGVARTAVTPEIIDEGSFPTEREKPFLIFGSGAAKCTEALPWAQYVEVEPTPEALALLAERKYSNGELEDMTLYEPMYLKDFVATESKKKLF